MLQLTKASDYTNQTLIKEGTILLTGAGSLGSGEVTLGGNGDAFLTYAVAVSYTHLDVYKRQAFAPQFVVRSSCLLRCVVRLCSG